MEDDAYADFLPLGTKVFAHMHEPTRIGCLTSLQQAFYSRHRFQPEVYYSIGTVALGFPCASFLALLTRDGYGNATYTSEFLFSIAIMVLYVCAYYWSSSSAN